MHEIWSSFSSKVSYSFLKLSLSLTFMIFSSKFSCISINRGVRYHEPEYWKFGEEGNKYFRHATGQLYAISKDLATYISINQYDSIVPIESDFLFCSKYIYPYMFHLLSLSLRHVLHKYANEDVSLGSWFIGLDVEHIDDRRLCCGTPPGMFHLCFFLICCCCSY